MKAFSAGAKNWKTTTAGAIGGVLIVLTAVMHWLDGDPSTVANWDAALTATMGIVVMLWGLLSRDADISSRTSGAE